MGRWTVAEWLAQAQVRRAAWSANLTKAAIPQEHSPLPIGEDECGDGTYHHYIDTLVEEDDDDFEDEEEEDDYEKPLPARPKLLLDTRDLPPIPPPKIASARSPAVRAGHSFFGSPKQSRRTRGKRGKADVAPAYASENPDRRMDDDCHSPREGLHPRSPDTRRPLEFLPRSGVRRPSKSKSKPKTAFGHDQYSYSGQALQIFVSTQVTATHSAHDAGRPRVFYPRSSSLPSAASNGLHAPPPPYKPSPPDKTSNVTPHSWSSRALPALPVASATDAPANKVHRQASTDSGLASSNGPRRIRPLPVPRPPP
ncbi:hypothetical protein DFH08DRAFT_879257 [Mycena albidolilacea]|uniref:Uncharacterized protein n=1 Tax=Mycena albidolilacea TaxID=1033008 RepID=A0AAD6ZQR2_9AGAR|nr:hypothetical protein DFH08DRAFT_879257 [Mycena albidolilacea]